MCLAWRAYLPDGKIEGLPAYRLLRKGDTTIIIIENNLTVKTSYQEIKYLFSKNNDGGRRGLAP